MTKPTLSVQAAFAQKDAKALVQAVGLLDVNERDAEGWALLDRAVEDGWREGISALLTAGAHANRRAPGSGLTALMRAAARGDEPMIELLLANGARPAVLDERGCPAAAHAAGLKDPALRARAVLALSEGVEASALPSVWVAVAGQDDADLLGRLFERVPPSEEALVRVAVAAARANAGSVWAGIGLTPAAHHAALIAAARAGAAKAVAVLLKRVPGTPAAETLVAAVEGGDAGIVHALLERGVSPNAYATDRGIPVLSLAAATGQAEVCTVLLEGGADPNRADLKGRTAGEALRAAGIAPVRAKSKPRAG